jgi:hypothetical protein
MIEIKFEYTDKILVLMRPFSVSSAFNLKIFSHLYKYSRLNRHSSDHGIIALLLWEKLLLIK